MSREDLDRWEPRWRDGHAVGLEPEPFLMRSADALLPGPILDIAAGAGRNALWLARRGVHVTAIDIAPAAVARLTAVAAELGVKVDARAADLDEPDSLAGLGPFAGMIAIRYRPSASQWARLVPLLRPGGRVLLCSFAPAQHRERGFPLAYCLDRPALEAELTGLLALLSWESYQEAGDFLAGSLWQRPQTHGQ